MNIDELDQVILKGLQINARLTNKELASNARVAPSTSLERVRSLERRGVIDGYHASVNLEAVGRSLQALISVRITPPSRKTFEVLREWLLQLPEVVGLFVVSGSHDFLIHVAVADTQDLYAFVVDGLTRRPEVADMQTTLVYEHTSKHEVGLLHQ